MKEPIFKYDELSDTMDISFVPNEVGTGIELNEHILLRVSQDEKCAVGLTLLDYSILAQRTEIGYRSLPLNGLNVIPPDIRKKIVKILLSPPVCDVLSMSAYTPSITETIPITSLRHSVLERKAA